MKLGFVSAIFPELSLGELLAFAKAQRLACIEAMCWPAGKAERRFAGVTHVDVTNFTKFQAEEVNALCEMYCVSLSGLGFYPNPLDPDAKVAETAVAHIKKVILAAEKLGLQVVNTFAGRDWTKTVDENWPRFLRTWRPLAAFAEDHDVKIALENCPMLFTRDEWPGGKNLATTPAIWRRIFNDIPGRNLGLNYDPSHFVFQFMDPIGPLREFAPKIFHIHAKDVMVHRDKLNQVGPFSDPVKWHEPRIPGFGEINWAGFMGELTAAGYNGAVCIEVEDDTFGRTLPGRKRALKIARNVLQPFFDDERETSL